MLSQLWNPFRVCSASDKIRSAYAQCAMKFIPRSMDLHVKTVQILPLAEHAWKFVPRMLSVRWNRFLVCSVWDKIVSTYAQHAHAIIFENYSKIPEAGIEAGGAIIKLPLEARAVITSNTSGLDSGSGSLLFYQRGEVIVASIHVRKYTVLK